MRTATNPETGEQLVFKDGAWKPRTATNPKTGEKLVMKGGEWTSEFNQKTPREQVFKSESKSVPAPPKEKSSWPGRFATGARDPIVGGAQFINNALPGVVGDVRKSIDAGLNDMTGGVLGYPEGDINAAINKREQEYQSKLPTDEGFDEARMLGNVATSLAATKGLPVPKSFSGALGQGAAMGGGFGASNPVIGSDYWGQKGSEVVRGAAAGGLLGLPGHALQRMISPVAANNSAINSLEREGVNPTIGQTLGGGWNTLEQKATSIPIVGEAIRGARETGRKEFNKAVINRATRPIGETVDDIGTLGNADASAKISKAYDEAMDIVPGIKLDGVSSQSLNKLENMAQGLPDADMNHFNRIYKGNFLKRLSPAGGMTSRTYKELDSELGKIIRGTNTSAKDAFRELQNILRQQAARTSPEFAAKLKPADLAFANMVRIENASNKAGLNDGVFTPGQMVNAIKTTDKSARKKDFSQGKSLGQDFAVKGQKVLGDTYPDSGTAGRTLLMGTAGVGGLIDPITTAASIAGLVAAGQAYRPGAQKALRGMVNRKAGPMQDTISKLIGTNSSALTYPVMGLFD